MRNKSLLILLVLILVLSACGPRPAGTTRREEPGIADRPKAEPSEIVITAVGDIMVHAPQLKAQYNAETGQYDFSGNFRYVKQYIGQADLSLANLETVFAGESMNFSGYPLFNTPDSLADALKEAGFDIIVTANNHCLDRGKSGIIRTVDVLKERGLGVVGTRRDDGEDSFMIIDVKGIQVGLSAFTHETPGVGGQKTVNGILLPADTEALLDSFNYEFLEQDAKKMAERALLLRDRGAEVVVFYMHWGDEYKRYPNSYQKRIAEILIEGGVDIIFGSHPHVIQPIDIITTSSYRRGVVVYSMGNFLSNQRHESINRPYTEDGVIVSVVVRKDVNGGAAPVEVYYTPTWVHRFSRGEKFVYEILPLPEGLKNREAYNLLGSDSADRAQKSLTGTAAILNAGSVPAVLATAPYNREAVLPLKKD